MSRKRFTPEQIVAKLHKAGVALSQGVTVRQICRQLGIAEQTYFMAQGIRWTEGQIGQI